MNHEVAQLIEVTRTRAGMTVNPKLEERLHRTNMTRSAEECTSVNLEPHTFHWELCDDFTVSSTGFLGHRRLSSCYSHQSSHV